MRTLRYWWPAAILLAGLFALTCSADSPPRTPPPAQEAGWEYVALPGNGPGFHRHWTGGGWLVYQSTYAAPTMTFVPDPYGAWDPVR